MAQNKEDAKYLESYTVDVDEMKIGVRIKQEGLAKIYELELPVFGVATHALINELRKKLLTITNITEKETTEATALQALKARFRVKALEYMQEFAPGMEGKTRDLLIGHLLSESFGLGPLEVPFNDPNLEEIVVNSSREPVWVYHRKYGWLMTNVIIPDENQIANYSSTVARRVGRSITTLNPLLDAHLVTGDRVNATLFPISTRGNTLTIRKFARKPWTIVDFMANKTLSPEVAALLWQVIQYEGNIIVSGGTATGKTAFLQTCLPFIQPNHRIISIEDTRELYLPEFVHWVPLTTREANPEGKGEVSMLDLMINSLRMRPDRIVVGEIRRKEQAEVLFEAMHTGHSVYSTLHADTADQTVSRMTNPPIDLPKNMMDAVDLIVTMFRDRRKGFRRVLELAEVAFTGRAESEQMTLQPNIIYRWRPVTDNMETHKPVVKLWDKLGLYTGLSVRELATDRKNKEIILDWLLKHNVTDLEKVSKIFAAYYNSEDEVLKAASANKNPETWGA